MGMVLFNYVLKGWTVVENIICGANPIKEVLTAGECLDAIQQGVASQVAQGANFQGFPFGDGGDGFLEAIAHKRSFTKHVVQTTAPMGDLVDCPILIDESNKTAYIESATCCGLRVVEPHRRDVMMSSTAGLADLIAVCVEKGMKKIYIGLGGSATCDGGVGMLWKLACHAGQHEADACDPRTAIDLAECAPPDVHLIQEWLEPVKIIACCDVLNPLLGPEGTAQTYGPQKGASPEQVDQLENWMQCWAARIERHTGLALRDRPGAGAAGGLGFALATVGAELVSGAQTTAELTGLTWNMSPGVTVITTEGVFDETSFNGKAPWVLARLALNHGARPVIFCGSAEAAAADRARAAGAEIVPFAPDLPAEKRISDTAALLRDAVSNYFQTAGDPS